MTPSFDVQAFVDGQTLRAVHYRVLALCALTLFVDGFDVFVVGKVAPAIAAGYGAPAAAMTTVFLLQQIGLALGAFAASPLADRFGRQRMIVCCALAFGAFSIVSPFARTLRELAVLRGLSGFFLSGMLPMVVALIAETIPRSRRGSFIAFSMAGYSAGSAAGGAVAAWFIDLWGWQSTFWIGGGLPLAIAPLLIWFLPESLPYLTLRVRRSAQILAGLRRLNPAVEVPADVRFVTGDEASSRPVPRLEALLGTGRRRVTLLMWGSTCLSMGSIALLGAWLPTFFQEMRGIPIQRFAVFAMIGFSGGLAGTLSSGWLMDRFRAQRLVPAVYVGLAACLACMGLAPFGTLTFLAVLIGYNFCQSAGQGMLNMLLARIYPASIRSTGIGWAGGMGRTGGIFAPLIGGLALGSQLSFTTTMSLIAALPVAVAALLWRLPISSRAAS